ncbi:hypothetical protein E2C01_030695 [Portunus trituberculatus]|uniref:Uncharacterized protein n=1 Tax=Portunus trituberculatus TaxID=210409 RepID=A0A5B7ER39_PORTR|nr:hypothetical protein [Portunus trituberculatus]
MPGQISSSCRSCPSTVRKRLGKVKRLIFTSVLVVVVVVVVVVVGRGFKGGRVEGASSPPSAGAALEHMVLSAALPRGGSTFTALSTARRGHSHPVEGQTRGSLVCWCASVAADENLRGGGAARSSVPVGKVVAAVEAAAIDGRHTLVERPAPTAARATPDPPRPRLQPQTV